MKFPTSTLALLMPHLIPNSRTQRQWQASKATLFSSEVGRPMSAGPSRNDFSCAWWLKSAFRRWATAGNVKLLLPPRQSRGASLGRLGPHATLPNDRILLAGPDIILEPRFALSLHMIFHELATNASKHGALTSTSGVVEVIWNVLIDGSNQALAVQWREQGGPEVTKPQHKGFGMRLISKALTGAKVDMDFAPAGLVCRLLVEIDPS